MKILLCNEAYIGDLILSTAVLKPLKKVYPQAKIGFLVGSWGKAVIEDHAFVDYVHVYDQESFNRSWLSKRQKKLKEIITKKIALKEVQNINYDLAIDLHSYYKENSAHILFKAEIPKRVGYWTCKKPFFYNEVYSHWDCRFFHMLENHKVMLSALNIDEEHLIDFGPCLDYKTPPEISVSLPEKYMVIHVGTGELGREWDTDHWKKLAMYLETLGLPLIFVGKGVKEKERIHEIVKSLKNYLNYCDQLSWKQLIPLIKKAKFLVGLESMAGHLAAYAGIPALLIYAGPLPINWRPYHPYCQIIRPKDCYILEREKIFPKEPISLIQPEEVFDKIKKMFKAHKI